MTSVLEARDLKIPGRLRGANLQVDAGELVAVVGPNGEGKTSLLRACAALEGSSGSVIVKGEDLRQASLARRGRLLGYLPASREFAWPVNVRDVVALGLHAPEPRRVDQLLSLLELEELADRPADQLSTGERARVLLGRVLAPRPCVLLLDEPLSNLDPYWALRLIEIVHETAEGGTSVLMSLHDVSRLDEFNRVLLVAEGEVIADLPPEQMVELPEFSGVFRIVRSDGDWRVSPRADRRSSQ